LQFDFCFVDKKRKKEKLRVFPFSRVCVENITVLDREFIITAQIFGNDA
jgi:hypothetical protein